MATNVIDLINKIKNPLPIYFIYGEDRFLQTDFIQCLKHLLISEENQDFNFETFEGKSSSVLNWIEAAKMISFLGGDKLVVVRNIEDSAWNDSGIKDLINYTKQPVNESCLVLTANKVDRKRKLYKELCKLPGAAESNSPKISSLQTWLRNRSKEQGANLTPSGMEALLNRVGPKPGLLANELEKVITFVGKSASIGSNEVEAVVGKIKMEKVFALTDAIKMNEVGKAWLILKNQLSHGVEPLQLLGTIAWQFRIIWEVKACQDNQIPKNQIAQNIGANPFVVDQAFSYTRNFSEERLRNCFKELLNTDKKLKTSNLSAEGILEGLILKLCLAGSG